ncbi:BEL1-like homeodomain protein 7 isoform X1 [Canna indica]|uniref:BEL1-like homeodomain protein 7 isoform X1 n=1 Tax=Canna indica TaxID=4628 RepID=A0AAQ3KZL1_9LILI|nr:BEL1-like homeodomain protein 7 isoform X1 [Canna indica]
MSSFHLMTNNQNGTTSNICLRGPGNAPYSESSLPSNMMYLSFSNSGPYTDALAGNTQTQQNHLDIPVATSIISQGITGEHSDMLTSRLGNHAYNAWKDGRNEMLFMPTVDGSISSADDLLHSDDPQMNLRTQLGILNAQSLSSQHSNISVMHNQGLSLSLSTQMSVPSFQYQPSSSHISFIGSHQSTSGNVGLLREVSLQSKSMHDSVSHSNLTSSIPNSKYLRAAQELLDEVINVGKALKQKAEKSQGPQNSSGMTGKYANEGTNTEGIMSNPQETTVNSSDDLSPSERQDLQNKVTKLLGMLDEVDRRYKQYYHQMQIIVSCFDTIAGCGAAKPYTSLALQTISRHFRCLRDAISGQIRAMRKSLGEPDNSSGKIGGLSRLRYIDQQLRQQRTMQQFGMMQQNAWRPQRGLPETSVSVLRAWLFEHFLHPYPKDSEKLMLARQTGLSRSQVANWFINARVRLWKPMIEDMYKEEFGDIDIDSNSSSGNPPKLKEDNQSSEENEDLQNTATARCQTSQISDSSRPSLNPAMNITESVSAFQNEPTTQDSYMNMKISDQRPIGEDSSFFQDALAHPDRSGRFFSYEMAELGQYGHGGVSLTLGLQQCDVGLPVSDNHQDFLTVRGNDVYGTAAPEGPDTDDYDYANAGDRQPRFGSTHLLHDFVT